MNYHKGIHHETWGDRRQSYNRQTKSRQRSPWTDLRQSSHFKSWVDSLGKPPKEPARNKFEYIFKVTGTRYIKFPGSKIALTIQPMLNVMERSQIVDYALGEHSHYTVNCNIVCVEGPGVKDKKGAAIITAKIISVRYGSFVFNLPEKYHNNPDIDSRLYLPGENNIIRVLIDPLKQVDSLEGLLLSYSTTDIITRSLEEKHQYVPPKYTALLAQIHSSDLRIGNPPA